MVISKVFNKSIKGASHIASGKPCQDYSGTYEDQNVQIVVVCDGHGGSTYVRSDAGSRFATEVTIECLQNFARCNTTDAFSGKNFSITAQPKRNPFIDADGKRVRYEDLDDTQKQFARQAQSYIEADGKYPETQSLISELFTQIYTMWRCRIDEDVNLNPLTKAEKKALGNQDIAKAYGCTLLAFLKTDSFWFAFQIGDGSIHVCCKDMVWTKPVPEDCTCFLNYTTSLCDSNPIMEFRYAFCGEGEMPFAVMLCSDGVDGSLRTSNNLHDFYGQVVGLFLDGDDVNAELESYLPQLSESGNRDDMSLAGIVDLSMVQIEDVRKSIELKNRERAIQNEYRARKSEIDNLTNKIDTLQYKLERQKDARFMMQSELEELRKGIQGKEKEYNAVEQSISSLKTEIEALKHAVAEKQTDFESWKFTVKNEMAELESAQTKSESDKDCIHSQEYTNW